MAQASMPQQLKRTSESTRTPVPSGNSLRIEGASKIFTNGGRSVEALRPIDLEIAAGEFVCFLGPSGCGKSTLLSIIAGLESASGGTVWANETVVTGPGTDRILLFQEAALFPWLDVQHNIEFGLRLAGLSAPQRKEIVEKMIRMVHLKGFERSYIHQLSGGMRQRVAIARALAINPAVLLMDEPFGALDALTRDRLHSELETIWSATKKTIVFVTHNVREAVALGDRVIVFSPRPGRILHEFRIDLPRPRSLENHQLVDHAAEILRVLKSGMTADEEGENGTSD